MNNASEPTLLVLAPAFPPSAESGVHRTLKFVKYLQCFGWSSVVVSLSPEAYPFLDEDLGREIPDHVAVYRTGFPSVVRKARDWVDESTTHPSSAVSRRSRQSWKRLLRWSNIVLVPDTSIAWLPYAVRASMAAVRKHHPRALLVSAPPSSVTVIGAIVSRLSSLPLIVDFRDGWTVEPYYRQRDERRSRLRYWTEGRMESLVFRRADRILCQQEVMASDYMAKYPKWRDKIRVLNNGFDEEDFAGLRPHSFERPTLLHTGYLEDRRNPEGFFRALALLRNRRPDVLKKWQVLLVGRARTDYPAMVGALGLHEFVRFHDSVSHRTALSMMLGASGLLLLTGGDESELPGKLFEYIGSRRPIFGVAHPRGQSAMVVEAAKAGMVVPNGDPATIAAGLEAFLDGPVSGGSIDRDDSLYRFTRRNAAEQLAKVLDEVRA